MTHVDDDLIDARLAKAMGLRKERRALVSKIKARHERYAESRKPLDDRLAEVDAALAEIIVTQPTATEPAASPESPGDEG